MDRLLRGCLAVTAAEPTSAAGAPSTATTPGTTEVATLLLRCKVLGLGLGNANRRLLVLLALDGAPLLDMACECYVFKTGDVC